MEKLLFFELRDFLMEFSDFAPWNWVRFKKTLCLLWTWFFHFLDIFARKSLAFFWGAKNLIVEISQTGFWSDVYPVDSKPVGEIRNHMG